MDSVGYIILLINLIYQVSAETCYYYNTYGRYTVYKTCPTWLDSSNEDRCCGSGSSQYCCADSIHYPSSVSIGQIVGGVISAVFFIGVFIAIIVCCCSAACPLYQRRHYGRVHYTGGQTVVVSHNQQMQAARPQVHPQFIQQGPVAAPPYQYAVPTAPAYPPPPYQQNQPFGVTNYGYSQAPVMPPPSQMQQHQTITVNPR